MLILFSVSSDVLAHKGNTDSFGGHTDHDTGEYHYHHGYSAHDHYDMNDDGVIDCPYDFNDQTNHSQSGDSENSIKSSSNIYIPKPNSQSSFKTSNTGRDITDNKGDTELRAFWWVTIILTLIAVIVICIIKAVDNNAISILNADMSNKDKEIRNLKDKMESMKKEYADAMLYANKSIYDITNIPKNVEIAMDGTPQMHDVFIAGIYPKTVHGMPGCRGIVLKRCGFYEVSHLNPCSYCASHEMRTFRSWFPDYAEKVNYLAKYKVPIKEQIDYDKLSIIIKNYGKYYTRSYHPYIKI